LQLQQFAIVLELQIAPDLCPPTKLKARERFP